MWPKTRAAIWEVVKFVAVVLLVVLPIRVFIAQPFIVRGASMVPTFHDGDYLIVDEISYRFHPPAKGDVVVFRYPKDPREHFIKRIAALPGETVSSGLKPTDKPYTLAPDEYFVLGDNTGVSLDSRYWGPLPARFLTGRVLFRLFPPAGFGLWPGAKKL